MLEKIDLKRKVKKADFKEAMEGLEIRMGALQREARKRGIPVMIVFEGWDAAGKGTQINDLILPLDPRGFKVHSTFSPSEEEALRPFLWRFWIRTPARGRIAVFDRSWYWRLLVRRVEQDLPKDELHRLLQDIRSFERQFADDGFVIIKLFLHISRGEQKKRFEKLRKNPATEWRVDKEDLKRHRRYGKYLTAIEDILSRTDSDFAPWTVVEAHNERFATLKIFHTVIAALERRMETPEPLPSISASPQERPELPVEVKTSLLEGVDLSLTLEKDRYEKILDKRQEKLRILQHEIYMRRISVVIVYEGWDAAGKGGNIRRLTRKLDPRGYEVIPIGAPNDTEKDHHYLWRFWNGFPKAGHIAIYDRSWYGRVLVERVEGLCREEEWRRAYREINEMERHMTSFGAILIKFWLHIDGEEQLRRFERRKKIPHKEWKITAEDWRNRRKWDQYREAVDEMLLRTGTPLSPWTIVESNCKRFARVKALDTVIAAIETRLEK